MDTPMNGVVIIKFNFMKLCKICKKVKFDWQFFKEFRCYFDICDNNYTDICKKCAKEIAYKAVIKENDKIK
jgi:hypothetical protein